MAESGLSQSEISNRSGIALATLNAWITGRRAPGKGPEGAEKLRALAGVLPGVTVREVFEAAGRSVPGPVSADAQAHVLALYRALSPGRQRLAVQVMETLAAEESASTG